MADKTPKKSNIKHEYNVATTGLNMDSSQNNIQKGSLSYALNAAMENFDANSVQYQNEPGNAPCFDFPSGYKLIGKHFIPEQNKIVFFLANPSSGGSEIGFMINNDCVYHTLVNNACLNFDVNYPVLRMAHKVTNFGTEIYWPDNNGRRYLDIDNVPYIPLDTSDICDPTDSSQLDCNKLLLQPDVNIPFTSVEDVISGGEMTAGTYQFVVQYADSVGNPYTSYYGVTNPVPIADTDLATVNFNYPVGKSIVIKVDNLDPLGQYQYFNLAVIKTINNISTPELVGTYFIDDTSKKITFTGQIQTNIKLAINDIFEKFAFYDKADHVTSVQDILVWKGMTAVERLNYQKIANEIKLQWQSYRIPASESYANEINATNLRGYLRDEIYAFEVIFLLKSGKETDGFHIPGKKKGQLEITAAPIDETHPDFIGTPDQGTTTSPYWKIYNTASVEATNAQYDPTDDEYKGPYQYGDFAYWESTEEYPCDEDVWGELAGEKIRHHKFPDVLVSPIIEGSTFISSAEMVMENSAIFPLGVKIDSTQIKGIIERSDLTEEQKNDIVGYRIARADRGVNKSIIAKGMLRNVGKYTREQQDYFYPNYPYNDLSSDVFLNQVNNAWLDISDPFLITVLEFNMPEGNPTYLEVVYNDPNTNKETSIKYDTLGEQEILCSIGKPKIQGPGVKDEVRYSGGTWIPVNECIGTVRYLNYDVWKAWVGKTDLGTYKAGYRLVWDDPIEGQKEEWMSGSEVKYVNCISGTQPRNISTGNAANNEELAFQYSTDYEHPCQDETPSVIEEGDIEELSKRQIFNSPETSFGNPFLGGILKLESVMFGRGKAHFVEVKDNAKYRLITKEAQKDALKVAEKVADVTQTFSLEAMFAVYNSQMTIFRNEITKRNFARSFNSIASYNYTTAIPNDQGVKQRELDIKRYLIPEVLNVGEQDVNINNWQRETSVYLRSTSSIPVPSKSPEMLISTPVEDHSRFTISEVGNCSIPENEEDISVVSYYGSMKNQFLNQYGQIYSYETLDTGFTKIFDNLDLNDDIIFGGDTFIGKFAYKTKLPFFIDNRVKYPDDSDIFYDEIGNIAYPKYWHSSRSILETYYGERKSDLVLSNFISYKAHNFDCPNDQGPEDLSEGDDPENYSNRTFYDGYYYLFAYGVPSFYCESSYNVDLRTAFNNKEGDFWPHVSTGIPDDWVQETNVTIAWDNTYNYNVTFSKQNKETVFTNLPADWGDKEDREKYPFRAVYSDPQITDADNRVNNWLTYRPISYFDFPQNYGGLTALDGLKNRAILARFENKSLLYNSLITIDTSNPQAAYVGNPNLFENQPIDFAETDQGYIGSQHKMMLKTPYGAVSIDAKRGQVFLINGTQLEDMSQFGSGMHRWFTAHLPFELTKYFPDVNTDNHFNGVGLHGVFDSNYERVIITKLDYIPLYDNISHKEGKYYIEENGVENEIFLIDSDYFCNVSWTLSFNFNTKSWISFHSYIPNWYVGENNFYYSGLNHCPNDFDALVGVLDPVVPTTTSTTTIPPSTTTTTTTTEYVPDCSFDASAIVPDCELTGFGYFLDEEVLPPCERPNDLRSVALYTGYTLVSPVADVDSTVSADAACSHLTYFNLYGIGDSNYIPEAISGDFSSYTVGQIIYDSTTDPDCTTIPDGWYFTSETAASDEVFEVVNGAITQFVTCGVPTTTTTTTQIFSYDTICWTGVYEEGDPIHPLGGVITYHDKWGNVQVEQEIWNGDYVVLEIAQIISAYGAVAIPCTTTTTTTTVAPTTTTTTTV
jgi:hypothetical protein